MSCQQPRTYGSLLTELAEYRAQDGMVHLHAPRLHFPDLERQEAERKEGSWREGGSGWGEQGCSPVPKHVSLGS